MGYLAIVAVHVLAAIVGFGTIFAVPAVRRALPDVAASTTVEVTLARRILTPAASVSLASGLTLVTVGPRAITEPWVLSSLLALVVVLGIAGAGTTRGGRELLAASRDGGDDARVATLRYRLTLCWVVSGVLVVAAVVMMVLKPGG